jgi:hypothetical protein
MRLGVTPPNMSYLNGTLFWVKQNSKYIIAFDSWEVKKALNGHHFSLFRTGESL